MLFIGFEWFFKKTDSHFPRLFPVPLVDRKFIMTDKYEKTVYA